MQSSAIYDPHLKLTPSQRLAAEAHNMRNVRIASRAVPDTPMVCPSHRLPVVKVEHVEPSIEEWVERQVELHPKLKQPWFSIESEIIDPLVPVRLTIEQIIRAVSKYFGVRRSDIMSDRRTQNIVVPRQVVYYLARMLTHNSLPRIGRHIGGRDHTSALHGINKIAHRRTIDLQFDHDVRTIAAELGGSLEN